MFTACGCDATGSSSLQCADTSGQCTCNAGYKGTKCDAACGCTSPGSSGTACDASTGQCTCNNGYTGTTCATVTSETKFYLKMTIKTSKSTFLTDPTYKITCTISISGVDLSTGAAGDTGKCDVIVATQFPTVSGSISIPSGSATGTSGQIFEDETYIVSASATVGGTAKTGNGLLVISGADGSVTVNLV